MQSRQIDEQRIDREKIVDELFAQVVDLGLTAREAFLADASAKNSALVREGVIDEVNDLLRDYQGAEQSAFLQQPLISAEEDEAPLSLTEGHAFEGYNILKLVAEGGMGEVYLALDPALDRKVAIKLIKSNLKTKELLRRFHNERQILANLQHANIAKLFQAGATADGVPYFVMEYVDGKPIDQYADEKNLSITERLKLFRTVCSAVSYAHQNLVIHRDIKPSNILVTDDREPRLLDFGIAKLLHEANSDQQDATITALRVMTPEYASPEQIKGEPITTATDVYSLGVLLYQLLTGQSPYKPKRRTADEITKAICEQEPTKPSQAIGGQRSELSESVPRGVGVAGAPNPHFAIRNPKLLRGDLDNILLKALRKEPQRRYATVEQFSEDIRRYLEGLPVIARKDTLPYRGAKFIQRNRSSVLAASTTALVGLVLAALFWLFGSPGAPVRSVAVLPFAGSGGPEGEYLSEGITDDLMNSLSRLPKLKVSPPSAVARYKTPDNLSLSSVGRDLGAEAVLTGKAIEQADSLFVTVELFDVGSNKRAWVKHYDRTASDILALQNEVTKDVAARLRLKLSGNEEKLLARRYTDDTEAYQAYLRGRHFWNQRTEESLNKSIEYFQQATQKDPGYALAYTGLADAYITLGYLVRPADAFPKAEENALKALQLDDTLAEAHSSLGRVKQIYYLNWTEAEKEHIRAIELNAECATAHLWYADYLIYTGRVDEGFAEVRAAQNLDPLSLIVNANYSIYLYQTRQYDLAIEQCRKTLEIEPRLPAAHFVLAESYHHKRIYDKAIDEYKRAISLGSGPRALGALGGAYAESGDKSSARRLLEQLLESSKQRYIPATAIADVYVGLGDKDRAFKWLERGYEERSPWMYSLKLRPGLESLRSDPRFTSLLQRMNLIL